MRVTVLYFASLREALGREREELELPPEVRTLGELRGWLHARGGEWSALAPQRNVRAARNQEMAGPGTALVAGDELAFFPPVTGG